MGKKAPKSPSPQAQASAQGVQDRDTAWYNAMLQNMNQTTPYGSLTYTQTGTKEEPKWVSNITLSPEQQQILDSQNRQDIAMSGLGEQQIGRIGESVATPYSYDNIQNALPTFGDINQASARAEEALMSRLNPQFERQEEAMRTRLINQGIGQGSQAYQREMETFNQAQNDARMQAILGGQQFGSNEQNMALQRRGQEISEYDRQRNAPLNEYIGLTSGTQIQNPSFSAGGNQGIGSFDIAGAMRNDYSNQMAAANNRNSAMSGLFGMGGQLAGNYLAREGGALAGSAFAGPVGGFVGSAVGSLFSDARLKENIKHIGEENGYPIYRFNYINVPDVTYEGVMAQDVLSIKPEAISESEGFMKVNYDMIGLSMKEVV
jgi:hypothetical protein